VPGGSRKRRAMAKTSVLANGSDTGHTLPVETDSAPACLSRGSARQGALRPELAETADHADQPRGLTGKASEGQQDHSHAIQPVRTAAMPARHADLQRLSPRSRLRGHRIGDPARASDRAGNAGTVRLGADLSQT